MSDDSSESIQSSAIRRAPEARPQFNGFRRFARADVDARVFVQDADGWEVPLHCLNLSPTGMFVESQLLFDVGLEHVLIFRSPRHDRLYRVRAKIVRVDSGTDDEPTDEPGMAYEFLDTDEATWESLCELVA